MAWLFRNWHLKLGALAVSMILYAGLVFSGSFVEERFPGVPIVATNQPANTYLLTQQLGTIDITYRVTSESADRVTVDTFSATVDLSVADPGLAGEPQSLPIAVRSLNDAVEILSWDPVDVAVALDRLGAKQVPVKVERGTVPPGLEIGSPEVAPATVQAQGPESRLRQVVEAVAHVRIDQSGIDVSEQVELEPVDIDGQRVEQVELTPGVAQVDIAVSAVETSKSVPVVADLTGSTAFGYRLVGVTVDPPVVTLFGTPDVLASIDEVSTVTLNLDNVAATVDLPAELVLPTDTHLAEGADSAVTVHVEVVVESATRTILVGLACANVDPGLTCLPGTEQISLLLSGSRAALEAVEPTAVTPTLDMAGLAAGAYQIVPEVDLPTGVSLVGSLAAVPVTLAAAGP